MQVHKKLISETPKQLENKMNMQDLQALTQKGEAVRGIRVDTTLESLVDLQEQSDNMQKRYAEMCKKKKVPFHEVEALHK